MKEFKVTIIGQSGKISYNVFKTKRGAVGFGEKVAREAFYLEKCNIIVESL